MEGYEELVRNNGLSTEDIRNIPAILALPAITAPPGGPRALSPIRQPVESEHQGQEQMWDEDDLLPLAHIINIMRRVLPADAGVPSDVAAILQRATSDFILLVTSQARERCKQEKHHKIKGDDIISALKKLGFSNYLRPLELYLYRYREHLKGTLHGNSVASPSMTAPSRPAQLQQEQSSEASTSHGSSNPRTPCCNCPSRRAPRTFAIPQPVESEHQRREHMWDEDHLLPLAHIINIMRRVLPAYAGVPSDGAAILQRATSDFILLCKQDRHKKIKGDDIIWALKKLGFSNYVRPLELYLYRYREHLKGTLHGISVASPSMTGQSRPPQLQQEQLSEASTSHGSL